MARDASRLHEAVEELRLSYGADAGGVAFDLTNTDGIEDVVRGVAGRRGPVEILILNCGGPPPGPFSAVDDAAWEKALDLVLRSSVKLVRAVLPDMTRLRFGRIIGIASVAAREAIPNLTTSNTLRAGLLGLLKSLAGEVAASGILVNAVLPGYTATERLLELADDLAGREGTTRDAVVARWTSGIPLGRLGDPAEIGAAVAFLASEGASFITGAALPVDGGGLRGI